jgi:capsular exopolysaccharide synthesis family protein
MSKIYEAMARSDDGVAGQILPELGLGNTVHETAHAQQHDRAPEPAAAPVCDGDPVRTARIDIPLTSPVLPFDNTHPGASELYRMIRTKVAQDPRAPRSIVVTSPGPGDGKTVTAINVAGALSLKSAAVLLIDGDLRKPTIHREIGLPQDPGLADVLQGSSTLEEALVRSEQLPNLYILPAGDRNANPAELLDSTAWRALVARVRKEFDYVMIDSPPIAAVADYDLIQAVCDGVMLVVRPDHTPRKLCLQALRTVAKEKLMGTVVNYAEPWLLDGRNPHHTGYYQREAAGSGTQNR